MRRENKTDTITTFLGPEARLEGTIDFKGTIRVDGNVKGRICSEEGTVIIGEKAVVNADINVGVAIIMGHINGSVNAKSSIEIYPPGVLEGDIQAPAVSIKAGVKFSGNCSMAPLLIASGKSIAPDKSTHSKGDAKK